MNSGGCLNHCDVVRPTILFSLIFTGLKMLRYAVLDTVILFFFIQTNDCVVECIGACGCQQINFVEERINAWGVQIFFKYKYKGSVSSLQFGLSNLLKSLSLLSWMLILLLICDRFDKLPDVLVLQNGNTKG